MFKIETPNDPSKLILAWEAPKQAIDRARWAIGELNQSSDGTASFRYYSGSEFTQMNQGRNIDTLKDLGYQGFPNFKPSESKVFSGSVLEAFRRRLPPAKRSDYPQYLQHYGLDETLNLSDMALLAITGARLPGDGFELVDPLTEVKPCFEVVLQIAGYRHNLDKTQGMDKGSALAIIEEPENKHDTNAVKFEFDGQCVGRVNRLQAIGVKKLISTHELEAVVMRLNGTQHHPRAYALVTARSLRNKKAA